MPTIWIPALLRERTGGQESIRVDAGSVAEAIDALEAAYPGVKERLCEGDGLRPGLAVVIDAQVDRQGLTAPLKSDSEVHFIPAIGGG